MEEFSQRNDHQKYKNSVTQGSERTLAMSRSQPSSPLSGGPLLRAVVTGVSRHLSVYRLSSTFRWDYCLPIFGLTTRCPLVFRRTTRCRCTSRSQSTSRCRRTSWKTTASRGALRWPAAPIGGLALLAHPSVARSTYQGSRFSGALSVSSVDPLNLSVSRCTFRQPTASLDAPFFWRSSRCPAARLGAPNPVRRNTSRFAAPRSPAAPLGGPLHLSVACYTSRWAAEPLGNPTVSQPASPCPPVFSKHLSAASCDLAHFSVSCCTPPSSQCAYCTSR
jgi:hypothetical protein